MLIPSIPDAEVSFGLREILAKEVCRRKFASKANLTNVTDSLNPVSLDGNLTPVLEVTDRGEPGTSDSIAISLWNGDELLYSSHWDGLKSVERVIAGGNMKVHGEGFVEESAVTDSVALLNVEEDATGMKAINPLDTNCDGKVRA